MVSSLHPDILAQPVELHVQREFTTLRQSQTVGEALASLRRGRLSEKIVYFYVLDEQERLVGVLPTRRILMSEPATPLEKIMVRNVISIPRTMTVEEACEFFVMHRLLAFPVVDEQERLVGVVDVNLFTDEMLDVAERQATHDVFQLIGIHVEQVKRRSPVTAFANRFPWLLCNIGGGLACAFLVGAFEGFLETALVLALFIPVVLALAESVSMQSMTITLQQFHQESVSWRRILSALRGEFFTAVLLGLACGSVVGGAAWIWRQDGWAALVIGSAIACSIVTACLLGVLLPAVVRLFKGDPRIAAGPIVLATTDLGTLLFYFLIAISLM